jgi:hypothetical protein
VADNSEFFNYINQVTKYINTPEQAKQSVLDYSLRIKQYLDTLNLDKRKKAVGLDFIMWFYDMFGNSASKWHEGFASNHGDGPQELLLLTKQPVKTLISSPSWNVAFAKLVNEKSNLTFINSYQLDLFEQFCIDDPSIWDYATITRQEAEAGSGGPFDLICINTYDIIHDPSVVIGYFNMLETNGVMVIPYANDGGTLYDTGAEDSPYYEINKELKALSNSLVYHDYSSIGTTYVIKL